MQNKLFYYLWFMLNVVAWIILLLGDWFASPIIVITSAFIPIYIDDDKYSLFKKRTIRFLTTFLFALSFMGVNIVSTALYGNDINTNTHHIIVAIIFVSNGLIVLIMEAIRVIINKYKNNKKQ